MSRPRLPAALALCIVSGLASGPLQAQDPFAPHTVWAHDAPEATPWLPSSVVIGMGASAVFASADQANPKLLAFGGAGGWVREADAPQIPSGLFQLLPAGSDSEFFSVMQVPGNAVGSQRLRIRRHSALSPAGLGAMPALWNHDLGLDQVGLVEAAVTADGSKLLIVASNPSQAIVRVRWLAGDSGAVLGSYDLPGDTFNTAALSSDGERSAVFAAGLLRLFDGTGQQVNVIPSAEPCRAMCFGADQRTLHVGTLGRIWSLTESGGVHSYGPELLGNSGDMVLDVAVAQGGLAATWFDGLRPRVTVHGSGGSLLRAWEQAAGSQTNRPSGLEVGGQGKRLAVGFWGNGTDAEVWLLDVGSPLPVMALDLPGSVTGLDLDASGTRVAVAYKHGHATQLAGRGGVRLFDTGERDLTLRTATELGGLLQLSAQRPGASAVIFLVGRRSMAPRAFPGLSGRLALVRAPDLAAYGRATSAAGRADLDLLLPTDPLLLGSSLHVQALFRSQAQSGFSTAVVDTVLF